VFDPKSNGYINSDELYKSLTTMGDRLTESEVGEMFAVQGVDRDGNFYYGDFMKEMFGARSVGSQ
jgi:Ca2+-binding EF-hand superfamily protein